MNRYFRIRGSLPGPLFYVFFYFESGIFKNPIFADAYVIIGIYLYTTIIKPN